MSTVFTVPAEFTVPTAFTVQAAAARGTAWLAAIALALALGWPVAAPAQSRPIVAIKLDTAGLPPELKPDPAAPKQLKEKLETVIHQQVAGPLCFFQWVTDHEATAAMPPIVPAATLHVKVASVQGGAAVRVYFDCSFQVGAGSRNLSFFGPDLFDGNQPLPVPAEAVDQTVEQARICLRTLFGNTYRKLWFDEFFYKVPLASDLVAAKPRLVVPVPATLVRARPESKLEALIKTANTGSGLIELSPIDGDTNQSRSGWLRCFIKKYVVGNLDGDGNNWQEVEQIVADKVKVTVHVKEFELDDSDEFSSMP